MSESEATFIVRIADSAGNSAPQDFAISVDYATSDNIAVVEQDYSSTSGTLTFAPGETEKTVTVPVSNNTETEGNESFYLDLSNVTGEIIDLDNQGVATITNEDDGGEEPNPDDNGGEEPEPGDGGGEPEPGDGGGEPEPGDGDGGEGELQNIELFRFRNTSFDTGTYVFVGAGERDAIQNNPDFNQTFELEGSGNAAFVASIEDGENLIPFYRLRSIDVPGTFLFVSTAEYDGIFAEDSAQRDKWVKEGFNDDGDDIAEFYLLDGSADLGIEFNRFQNTQNGTFLYAGPDETEAIANDPNLSSLFVNQGVAFESLS